MSVGVLHAARTPPDVTSLVSQQCHRGGQGLDVSTVSIDEHQPRRPIRGRPAELNQQKSKCGVADRNRAGKALVFAAGSVADRRCKHPSAITIGFREPLSNLTSYGHG